MSIVSWPPAGAGRWQGRKWSGFPLPPPLSPFLLGNVLLLPSLPGKISPPFHTCSDQDPAAPGFPLCCAPGLMESASESRSKCQALQAPHPRCPSWGIPLLSPQGRCAPFPLCGMLLPGCRHGPHPPGHPGSLSKTQQAKPNKQIKKNSSPHPSPILPPCPIDLNTHHHHIYLPLVLPPLQGVGYFLVFVC